MIVLGAFNVGFCIMLVPQYVVAQFDNGLVALGIIMSAWTAGPLIGPLMSKYIDQFGSPRYWISSLLLINSLLAFSVQFCTTIPLLFMNLLAQGLIYAVGYSILNLLIVRRFEESEWHGRTGMLIAAFIIGEVIGFGIAGRITDPVAGIAFGGYMMLASSALALVLVPSFQFIVRKNPADYRESHRVSKLLCSPFGIMAVGWGLLCFAAQILFLPFPVLMREVFLIDPELSSSVVSISGIIALTFYPIVGKLTERFGADNVLINASAVKTMVFIILSYCALNYVPSLAVVVLAMIFINRCTWPFMMASSQIQAAQLSNGCAKSMALTVFMAIAGIGNFMSGVVNSVVTATWGMEFVPTVAAVTGSIGVVLLVGNKYREYRYDNHIEQQKHYP
ncbi:MFS transporter [Photobacterium nomapromontoriensis]|uniref:MFS transporter n=1 Tax=Photobacterium nomapromontoriensis TaxID=2910237 RepID=UPI003D0F9603